MNIRRITFTILAALAWFAAGAAQAQAQLPARPAGALSQRELYEILVWNSPWEGRSTAAGQLYSYRTTFRERRDALLAEVVSYATNQRADSVVNVQDGRLTWQDSNGAEVTVSLAGAGDLVGSATSSNAVVPIVLTPRR